MSRLPYLTNNLECPQSFGMTAEPCPFCANTVVGVHIGYRPHCVCCVCGADGPLGVTGEPRSAIAGWNSRVVRVYTGRKD